jgi:hypothetical protein
MLRSLVVRSSAVVCVAPASRIPLPLLRTSLRAYHSAEGNYEQRLRERMLRRDDVSWKYTDKPCSQPEVASSTTEGVLADSYVHKTQPKADRQRKLKEVEDTCQKEFAKAMLHEANAEGYKRGGAMVFQLPLKAAGAVRSESMGKIKQQIARDLPLLTELDSAAHRLLKSLPSEQSDRQLLMDFSGNYVQASVAFHRACLLKSKATSIALHTGFKCDGCGQSPLRRDRYECKDCRNFDLCPHCHAAGVTTAEHTGNHLLVRVPHESQAAAQKAFVEEMTIAATCANEALKAVQSMSRSQRQNLLVLDEVNDSFSLLLHARSQMGQQHETEEARDAWLRWAMSHQEQRAGVASKVALEVAEAMANLHAANGRWVAFAATQRSLVQAALDAGVDQSKQPVLEKISKLAFPLAAISTASLARAKPDANEALRYARHSVEVVQLLSQNGMSIEAAAQLRAAVNALPGDEAALDRGGVGQRSFHMLLSDEATERVLEFISRSDCSAGDPVSDYQRFQLRQFIAACYCQLGFALMEIGGRDALAERSCSIAARIAGVSSSPAAPATTVASSSTASCGSVSPSCCARMFRVGKWVVAGSLLWLVGGGLVAYLVATDQMCLNSECPLEEIQKRCPEKARMLAALRFKCKQTGEDRDAARSASESSPATKQE